MLKYVTGNLITDSDNYDVIAHGCNCFCNMSAGIAPLIKAKYPEAYEVDMETKAGDIDKLGTISFTTNTTPIVANLYTQFDFRGRRIGRMDLDYDALRKTFLALKANFSGKSIAIPDMIGCGLAGGNRAIVIRILEEVMGEEDLTIIALQ